MGLTMNEQTPLLVSREACPISVRRKASYLPQWRPIWETWKIPILCYSFAFCVDGSENMRSTPRTRLFEIILCRRYYAALRAEDGPPWAPRSDIPEHMCKVPEVQSAVVNAKLWFKLVESLFALILAIPFGKLSNTKGRRFVLFVGITGQILSESWILTVCHFDDIFPFGLLYAASIFKSLGGGDMVLSAIAHAILADVVSEDKRAQAFFHMASVSLVSEVIVPPLGSMLMQIRGVYAPLLCVFPLQLLAIIGLAIAPHSIDAMKGHHLDQPDIEELSTGFSTKAQGIKAIVTAVFHRLRTNWTLIRANGPTIIATISFLATYIAKDTLDFLVQYVSKRFNWSLAKANYLISFRALTNLLLFLFVLPTITKILSTQHSMSPPKIDLWISRISSLFGILGPVLLGLAPTPALMVLSLIPFTLSLGYPHAIQSYGTSLVGPVNVAPFYSFLAMGRIAGTLVASPLLAGAFNLGLRVGGVALGLPFYVAAGLFGVGAWGAWRLG
ncbi:major facilitator superfamily domain-containing protein [Aspergillus alliaceus]|uniref:major facilitator superfamily domain-containing protein n=1 Tax=Petromyces alliaceus TaxID=209559 RepID=UPI0012A76C4E|nr:major facilitator superfamily domain-containing protein [Aspergillus alliaceus]KAB8238573.1 major facilitator superfamily domain-containing protein [Aspergillus alliaceus]